MIQELVNIKTILNADHRDVFSAWTRFDLLKKWWCTPGYRLESVYMDLEPLGRYRFELLPEEGNIAPSCVMEGEFQEVSLAEKLVYTWAIHAGDFHETNTTVTVCFRTKGAQTELELIHEGFSSKETYDLHALDWSIVLTNLEQLLSTLIPSQQI